MKFFASLFALIVLVSNAPAANLSGHQAPQTTEFYSFEHDMEGWAITGTDLEFASGGSIPWSITRSQDRAKDGNTSLKLDLQSLNGRGKIWIERRFIGEPNRIYHVTVG